MVSTTAAAGPDAYRGTGKLIFGIVLAVITFWLFAQTTLNVAPPHQQNFVPVEAHIKERPVYFHRFGAVWTPTVLILDSDGTERLRVEGYLPRDEFSAHLEMGLARVALMRKQWDEAERRYAQVVERYPDSKVAPEAIYWRA